MQRSVIEVCWLILPALHYASQTAVLFSIFVTNYTLLLNRSAVNVDLNASNTTCHLKSRALWRIVAESLASFLRIVLSKARGTCAQKATFPRLTWWSAVSDHNLWVLFIVAIEGCETPNFEPTSLLWHCLDICKIKTFMIEPLQLWKKA